MKQLISSGLILLFCYSVKGQKLSELNEKHSVDSINRLLDQSVVDKRMDILKKHYADDFVFTHGTGLVDSKQSWLKNVSDTAVHFIERKHDSVAVELHNSVAIVHGTLTVKRDQQNKRSIYALRYVRVYANRSKTWQLISHKTTAEWHLD